MNDLVPIVDAGARIFWCLVHLAGFVYIFRCWRHERRNFYIFFALEWLMSALRSFTIITLNHNVYIHVAGAIFISPAGSIFGFIAFRQLNSYVSKRITTIRSLSDADTYAARRFEEDDRDTLRPVQK